MIPPGIRLKFWREVNLLFLSFLALSVNYSEPYQHQNTGECDLGLFKCHNGNCVSESFVCDGVPDCGGGDRSDEESCHQLTTPPPQPCQAGEYLCNDRLCIPGLWVCDGEMDCMDGSDETHGCEMHVCDGFRCHSKGCIPKAWECDGVRDCPDNSDELHCAKRILSTVECDIHERKFLCRDESQCIPIEQVCNHHSDCDDGSDEGGLCILGSCVNHTCSSHQNCIVLPHGPTCIETCSKGYHYANGSCYDIDECATFGKCDQTCYNTIGGFNCTCIDGYSFDHEQNKCKAEGSEGLLFFTSKEEIRAYYLDSHVYFKVVDKLPHATGVAYDGINVYWSTVGEEEETIVKASENGDNQKVIVTSGLGKPEDLAVDWITRTLYFTDSKLQYVGVCSNDGFYCLILHDQHVDKPRAIVLHSSEGLIYWSDWGEKPGIMRSGMDGSHFTIFIKDDIHWPNGLSIDHGTNRLYWVDAKEAKIECIKLDGSDRRVVPSSAVKHPFSIDIFEDRIYWSDWDSEQIISCNKFTGKDCHTVVKEKNQKIYGIHIYHPSMLGGVVNPCYDVHCSDLCLLAPRNIKNELQYSCACPYHKKLSLDRHTCVEDFPLESVFVASGQLLIKVQHKRFGGFITESLKYTSLRKVGALAYDPLSDKIILSDLLRRKIFTFDWARNKSEILVEDNVGQVVGMDIDYYGNNLYWIDDEKKTVEVISLTDNHRLTLIQDLQDDLNDIALVLEHGFMFIAFSNNEGSHIDRISMDGRLTSRTHVIENKLYGPLSLHFDTTLDRLYWADKMTGEISSTGVEGLDRHNFQLGRSSPIDVTSSETDIFWLGYGMKNIFWSNKYDGSFTKSFALEMVEETDNMKIIGVNRHVRAGKDKCNIQGNCSHICLLSEHSGVCACPDGMELGFDSKTCKKQLVCREGQYKCRSGECISKSLRCNGRHDCILGDDEEYCPAICEPGMFACLNSSKCIDNSAKCDYKADCPDGSDERYCESNRNCSTLEFLCKSGECVPNVVQCDGMNDCRDGSDESNCRSHTCPEDQFRCNTGNCIPNSWVCDHEIDCKDGSDEGAKCSAVEACHEEQFTCENGQCISNVLVCNYEDDCGDSSDENHCYYPKPKPTDLSKNSKEQSKNNKEEYIDSNCQFICPSDIKICLPLSGKCNGTSECPEGEDESHCNKCKEGEFMCISDKRCLPKEWVCDNIYDCPDQSDEMHCLNGTLEIHELRTVHQCNGFLCQDGQSCISHSKVCDSHPDCNDGSDEKGHCGKGCEHAACHHKCKETPLGPKCECSSGYELDGDGRTCSDINECEKLSSCSQYCLNTVGSYSCSCSDSTYQLRSDKIRCKAKGLEMKYYFATKKEIKYKSQSLQETVVLYQSQRDMDIKGMDFDMNEDVVFWTSEISGYLYKMFVKSKNITHITNLVRPTKISYDWITGNIYVLENFKVIRVCNFDAKICSAIHTAKNDINIEGLALDPNSRILFWSENKWLMNQTPNSTLQKTSMSAEKPISILSFDYSPVSDIVVDRFHKLIYWSNTIENKIERCTYDGKNREVVLRSEYPPRDLAFFEDYLFWVNHQKQSHLIRPESEGTITKFGLYGSVYMKHELIRLLPLSSYNEIKTFRILQPALQQKGENHCEKLTCNYLCISDENDPICFCENGSKVKPGDVCVNHTGIHFAMVNTGNLSTGSSVINWFFWIGGLIFAAVLGYFAYYFGAIYLHKKKIPLHFSVLFPNGRAESQRDQPSPQVHQFENPTYSEDHSELKFLVHNEISVNQTV